MGMINMIKVRVKIEKSDDLARLNQAATEVPFDIDLVSGWYIVDAKSMIGIFSLDLTTPIRVDIHTDRRDAELFLDKIRSMIVK